MQIFGTDPAPPEVVIDIICDRCKKSQRVRNKTLPKELIEFSGATLEARWGYFSKQPDGRHVRLDLCDDCYDWLEKLLKKHHVTIPIVTSGYIEEHLIVSSKIAKPAKTRKDTQNKKGII